MMSSTKCYRTLKHYYLSSLIIFVIAIGFSFPVMAYHITYGQGGGSHYDESSLEYSRDYDGYIEWSWGDVEWYGGSFEVVSDPGDPVYDGFLVKASVYYYQYSEETHFYNFVEFPEYEVHFPDVSDFEVISGVPINQSIDIEFLMGDIFAGHTIVEFKTYPSLLDPADELGALASVWGETVWGWSVELIRPISAVPEPATLLLLGLGLIGLAGVRRKFEK